MDTEKTGLHADYNAACQEIITRLIKRQQPTRNELNRIKMDVCRELQVLTPKNSDILRLLKPEDKLRLLPVLKSKPSRTLSGSFS